VLSDSRRHMRARLHSCERSRSRTCAGARASVAEERYLQFGVWGRLYGSRSYRSSAPSDWAPDSHSHWAQTPRRPGRADCEFGKNPKGTGMAAPTTGSIRSHRVGLERYAHRHLTVLITAPISLSYSENDLAQRSCQARLRLGVIGNALITVTRADMATIRKTS
jgi:hypothetical protein